MRVLFLLVLSVMFVSSQAQPTLQKAEWFIDSDPGFHRANRIVFNANNEVEWTFDLSNLSAGVHRLGVRVLDRNGIWSHTLIRPFLVLPRSNPNITYAEYFIDDDPGFGSAVTVPINSDTVTWEIDLSDLEVGVHYLHIRTQQASGAWTHTLTRAFLVAEEGKSPIERIDYRYTDGQVNELQFSYILEIPKHYIDIDFEPDTTGLVGGENYELCFQVTTVNGAKSEEECLNFEAKGQSSSIENIDDEIQLSLYPNPTSKQLFIELPAPKWVAKWSMVDRQGIFRSQNRVEHTVQKMSIQVSDLESGYYTLIIETRDSLIIRNVVINSK
ncbi:MAG: T9SS type A sorting domain-containing protein [Bacteroidota bacterium]